MFGARRSESHDSPHRLAMTTRHGQEPKQQYDPFRLADHAVALAEKEICGISSRPKYRIRACKRTVETFRRAKVERFANRFLPSLHGAMRGSRILPHLFRHPEAGTLGPVPFGGSAALDHL